MGGPQRESLRAAHEEVTLMLTKTAIAEIHEPETVTRVLHRAE